MGMFRLAPHGETPPVAARGLALTLMDLGGGQHQLTYVVENATRLMVPPRTSPERTDNLWQMTCFELFLRRQAGPEYFEFNFSPSQQWAAYSFEKYRFNMQPFDMPRAPRIDGDFRGEDYVLNVVVSGFPTGMTVAGVGAVVVEMGYPPQSDEPPEEAKGDASTEPIEGVPTGSLWALNHPAPKPDFHHPASFVLPLAPGFR